MKKKVLLVNAAVTTYSGVSSVILNYAKKTFDYADYDIVIAGGYNQEFVEKECTNFHQIMIPNVSRTRRPIAYLRQLLAIMGKEKYDVIHVHCNSATAVVELCAAKMAGIPIRLVHAHTSKGKYPLLHYLLRPLMCKLMTQGLACSELAGKWMFTGEYTTIYNGIDIEKYQFDETVRNAYRTEMSLTDKFVIGHVGYMATEKNHEFLIKVFSEIHSSNPKAVLMLLGDGRLRASIEKQITDLGLNENVMMLGRRSDADKLYQTMDAFVLPSLWEGLPVSLIEAQTAGLPCVASATITKQANITGTVQYLEIGEANIELWAQTLLAVLEQPINRVSLGEKVKNSRFNVAKSIDDLLMAYSETK